MKLSVFCGVSVDGFLARPDDALDFLHTDEQEPHGFKEFLSSVDVVVIGRILPGIEGAPIACACIPRMTVTTAKSPFGDRFAIIGDAVGSRLNKDGLFSAHVTASLLA
jgi:hypothetical protein